VNLGNWDGAIIKSLSLVALGLMAVSFIPGQLPTTANDFSGLLVTFALFLGVYLLISVIGWLIIGFPTHWLICKYTNSSFVFYIVAALLVGCLLFLLTNHDSMLFGITVFLQVIIFRYFVYKKT
jgi:hypothetical protein